MHSLHTNIPNKYKITNLAGEAFFFYRYTNELACEFCDLG